MSILVEFMCAVITRVLFLVVSLMGVWIVTWVKNDINYWLLTFLFLPLVIEMIITLKRTKGKDYKWFSPAIFLFLICIIPSIWILELHHQQNKFSMPQCVELVKGIQTLNRTGGNFSYEHYLHVLQNQTVNNDQRTEEDGQEIRLEISQKYGTLFPEA